MTNHWRSLAMTAVLRLGVLPALAEGPTTDVGTLDRAAAERALKKRPYSPYAERKFPTRPLWPPCSPS